MPLRLLVLLLPDMVRTEPASDQQRSLTVPDICYTVMSKTIQLFCIHMFITPLFATKRMCVEEIYFIHFIATKQGTFFNRKRWLIHLRVLYFKCTGFFSLVLLLGCTNSILSNVPLTTLYMNCQRFLIFQVLSISL